VEPSWVLLPTQLVVQRLLDLHPVMSWFSCFRPTHCFFHERHDMLRSFTPVFETPCVHSTVTTPHHTSCPSYATTVPTDSPISTVPMTPASSTPHTDLHHARTVVLSAHDYSSMTLDLSVLPCLIPMPSRGLRVCNEVLPCSLAISLAQALPTPSKFRSHRVDALKF